MKCDGWLDGGCVLLFEVDVGWWLLAVGQQSGVQGPPLAKYEAQGQRVEESKQDAKADPIHNTHNKTARNFVLCCASNSRWKYIWP